MDGWPGRLDGRVERRHWVRGWASRTGAELVDDLWVGDQAWAVMALAAYAAKSLDVAAMTAAERGADWLDDRIEASGRVVTSTEGTVDVFWAMVATGRTPEAIRIRDYLLASSTVWDADIRYWWRGFDDPVVAMDTATWRAAFARHPLVGRPQQALDALGFVRRALVTTAVVVVSLSGSSLARGLAMAMVGYLMSLIGLGPATAEPRFAVSEVFLGLEEARVTIAERIRR